MASPLYNSTLANAPEADMDIENGFSSSLLTFAAVMTFLIMIVGITGNLLTVVALLKCPKVRNVAAAFIISLCIADLLFCAIVLPFNGLRFVQGTWTHGELLCKIIPFIQYGNVGVSLLCIAMITINRYVMIAHHTCYARIYKRHWIALMIAFCWLFSYGMQLPTLFGAWGMFGFDPKLATCSIMSDENGRSSKTSLFIIAFVIPCIIIIACYSKIFWVVHQSEMRMKEHANKQNSIPNNLRPTPASSQNKISSNLASDSSFSTEVKQEAVQKPSRVKDQREVRAKRNEWRITKMVLAIFLSFVICYLPITIAKVADKDVEHPGFHIMSYIMLYMSACINPIIYVIMNKQYRKAYKTVLMCTPKFLPFTKVAAPAEKWKEPALSNNHSRTMMSQMSVGEQQNTGLNSSQLQPIALELTTKPNLKSQMRKPPTELVAESTVPPAQHSNSPSAMPSMESPRRSDGTTTPQILPRTGVSREVGHRVTLVGDDIILEEEEEVQPAPPATTTPTRGEMERIYANMVVYPKKVPYYGQNINAIPNNDFNDKCEKLHKQT